MPKKVVSITMDLDQFMQVTLPGGGYYSQESTPNKNPNRLERRITSYLRKKGLTLRDVTTDLSVVNKNTGKLVRFTYKCRDDRWEVGVSVRCFNNSICPFSERFTDLTIEGTRDITRKFTNDYLC